MADSIVPGSVQSSAAGQAQVEGLHLRRSPEPHAGLCAVLYWRDVNRFTSPVRAFTTLPKNLADRY